MREGGGGVLTWQAVGNRAFEYSRQSNPSHLERMQLRHFSAASDEEASIAELWNMIYFCNLIQGFCLQLFSCFLIIRINSAFGTIKPNNFVWRAKEDNNWPFRIQLHPHLPVDQCYRRLTGAWRGLWSIWNSDFFIFLLVEWLSLASLPLCNQSEVTVGL